MNFFGGNFQKLIQGAMSLKTDMEKIKTELKNKIVCGSSGAGMVKVEANSMFQVLKIDIEQNTFDKGDKKMIEDLVIAAVNDALKQSESNALAKLNEAVQKIGFPNVKAD